MSGPISISIDISRAKAALEAAPGVVENAIDVWLSRGAEEVAREAKHGAPKLYSTLINSIRAERIGLMHYQVVEGVNYGRAVEEGTGPAAGKEPYYPNPDSLLQYLRMTPSMRGFGWAKKNSSKRSDQELELRSRSRALAQYIFQHGTKAQPYMQPALETKRSRLFDLVQQGVDEGIKEVFG